MRLPALALTLLSVSGCSLTSDRVAAPEDKNVQAVIFDIDGTLTPRLMAITRARKDAALAARLYAASGRKIIYLSARTRMLQWMIPGWLEQHGFPYGSIHVPITGKDATDHVAFKTQVLNKYRRKKWQFLAAYGDSSTDFKAYSAAGIRKDKIFALQREAESSCRSDSSVWTACLHSWNGHLDHIRLLTRPKANKQVSRGK